ncbi:MAG: hypothetical protein KC619_10340 [Myxococcales bacterium]|nr:hypothetical protein [Myxococcales bacterium]
MSGPKLERAKLIVLKGQSARVKGSQEIVFDFNPATLQVKVNTELEKPGKKSRQRRQFTGMNSASLSFEAVFDTTRPAGGSSKRRAEDLDVRKRTREVADLLLVRERKKPFQSRVRFQWGSFLFDGIVDGYSETLDFFSPEGVPLRARVQLSLTEQGFQYQFDESKQAGARSGGAGAGPFAGTEPPPAKPKDPATLPSVGAPDERLQELGATIDDAVRVAEQNGLESLLDLAGATDLTFDASAGSTWRVTSATVDISRSASVGAGVELRAWEVVEVFGGESVEAGGESQMSAAGRAPVAARSNPWAPAGPTPGSRAAELASVIARARDAGAQHAERPAGSFRAVARVDVERSAADPSSGGGASGGARAVVAAPTPVRGSPPTRHPVIGVTPPRGVFSAPASELRASRRRLAGPSGRGGRPSWEGDASPGAASAGEPPCCEECE